MHQNLAHCTSQKFTKTDKLQINLRLQLSPACSLTEETLNDGEVNQ